MVLYHTLNNYGPAEVVATIQGRLCLMKTLFLYKTDHKNMLKRTMLAYLVIDDL